MPDQMVVALESPPRESLRCPSLGYARDRQGKLGVAGLGGDGGQVEAQRVRIVLAREVAYVHEGATAF